MSNSAEQLGPTPDEIDAALQSFWHGSSREFDQLIEVVDGQGPAIGSVLSSVIESQWSSLVESYSIPGYTLIREIGRGGMAIVFDAVQQSTGRHVALKLVPGSGLSRERQAKFLRREVQTLSLLRHDGIATLFDAGQTSDNCQYFAMELIRGKPLSQHFAASPVSDHADLCRRLEMMLDVCNAVAYAHGRGVIHCDLKPSNVLVDEHGRAKVLDFGLARLLEIDPTTSLSLGGNGLMGTLAYMSPEQASGRASDIDIRSDVYAIGIMFYELMTGRRPYDLANLQFPQAIQRICQVEPRPPSDANPLLRGDVDTIALTALAKDPTRRYQTVAALAADIQRYLDRRPIEARPASMPYIIAKWCSRHRLSAGLIAALVLLIGAFAAVEIRRAFQLAVQRDEARLHAKRANQANAFLRSVFGTLDPSLTGADVSVLTVLDDAAARVDDELSDNAEARAELHDTFGKSYYALARFQAAEHEFEKAVALWKTLVGEMDTRYASSLHMSGMASRRTHDPLAAGKRIRRAHEIRGSLFQGDHVDLAESLHGLGVIHQYVDFPAAEGYFRRSLDMRRRLLDDHPLVAESLDSLGRMMLDSGRFSEAEPLLVQALEMRKRLLGPDATEVAVTLGLLAAMHDQCGFAAKAVDEYGEQIRIFTKAFDAKGSELLAHAMSDMAGALADLGRFAEAEDLYKKAVAMEQRCSATGVAELTRHDYAWLLRTLGRYDEAEPLARAVHDVWGRAPHDQVHTGVAYSSNNLGAILLETGRTDEAATLLENADQVWCKLFGKESPKRATTLLSLALVAEERGDMVDAESKLQTAVQLMTQSRGATHPDTAFARMRLGRVEIELGRIDEGRKLIRDAYEAIRGSSQSDALMKVKAQLRFAEDRLKWGEVDAARALFDEVLAEVERLKLDRHPLRADALLGKADIMAQRGDDVEARRSLGDALEIYSFRKCLDSSRRLRTSSLTARLSHP